MILPQDPCSPYLEKYLLCTHHGSPHPALLQTFCRQERTSVPDDNLGGKAPRVRQVQPRVGILAMITVLTADRIPEN